MAGLYINQHVLNNLFYILVTIFAFSFIYDHSRAIRQRPLYGQALLGVGGRFVHEISDLHGSAVRP